MRFILKEHKRLHEDESTPRNWQEEYDKAKTKDKPEVVKQWLKAENIVGENVLSKLDSTDAASQELLAGIIRSINLRTMAKFSNTFIKFLGTVNFELSNDACKNLSHLTTLAFGPLKLDLTQRWLNDEKLFNRTPNEFEYSVNLLNTASDESKLSKYFKDTSNVKFDHLFIGGHVKPAGIKEQRVLYDTAIGSDEGNPLPPEEQETLWAVAEVWALNGNDKQPEPKKKQKGNTDTDDTHEKVYTSFEEAAADGMNKSGKTITVKMKYTFDGKNWEPVKK